MNYSERPESSLRIIQITKYKPKVIYEQEYPRDMNIENRPGIIRTGHPPKRLSIAATVIVAAMLVPVIYLIIRTIGGGSAIFDLLWRPPAFAIVTN